MTEAERKSTSHGQAGAFERRMPLGQSHYIPQAFPEAGPAPGFDIA